MTWMNRKMKVCTIPIMFRCVDYGAPNQWTFIAFKSLKSGCCWLQSTVQGHRSLIYDTRKKWHFHVFKCKTLLGTPFLGSMITVTLINPLSPNTDPILTNNNFLLTISIQCQEIRLWELKNDHLRENSVIFYQILSTNC